MEYVTRQGVSVPTIGLGTWRLSETTCRRTVVEALDLGYRHIDSAQAYGNERAVGIALGESDVPRDELFITTKLAVHEYDDVIRSTETSLAKLDTDYVDLLLIHWPSDRFRVGGVPVGQTLDAMAELVERGVVRHIGVSNFDVSRLDEARHLSQVPLLTDQVQFHPWWDQTPLLDYCDINDVILTAYSPLAHGAMLTDPICREIADRHGRSPAQIALRWVIQHDGVVTIPKASSREHLAENLAVFDFELSDTEMEQLYRPSKLRTVAGMARRRLGR